MKRRFRVKKAGATESCQTRYGQSKDEATDVVATPEGDNEFAPDEPLKPTPEAAEEIPRGSAPDDYRQPRDKV